MFLFVRFGHPLKVTNHLSHENQKRFLNIEPAGLKLAGKVEGTPNDVIGQHL